MGYYYILTLLLSVLFSVIKFKNVLTINVLYTLTWTIGGLLNINKYAGLYIASDKIHFYIIISIITFNSFYIILSPSKKEQISVCDINIDLPIKTIVTLNSWALLFMIPFLIKAVKITIESSFSDLRAYAYVASDKFANIIESRIIIWVIAPLFFATIIIVVLLILLNKSTLLLNVIMLLDVVVYSLTLGGKLLIILVVLFFVLGYYMLKKYGDNSFRIKIKKIYYLIFILMIAFVFYLTQLRALEGLNIIENFIVYNYGGISYFDAILKSSEYTSLNSLQLYGTVVFGVVVTPFLYFCRHVLGIQVYDAEYHVKQMLSKYLYISDRYAINSQPTALYFFWRDFNGVIGIIFGTMALCLTYLYIESKFIRHKNIKYMSLLLFMLLVLFMTTQKYMLYEIESFMNIFFVIIFTSKLSLHIENIIAARFDILKSIFIKGGNDD